MSFTGMNQTMTWADFYLVCFAIGFCLSFFSFVFGGARMGRLHLPHFHAHGGVAHLPAPHGPGAHAPSGTASNHAPQTAGVSPFNFVTLTAFLAWFGGTGYLLTRYSAMWVGFGLVASIASGLVGGGIVFVFLSKVLISNQEYMDPADYEMVGVLGRVCSSIRQGGTGEMIYPQMGTRRVCGARSDNGSAIAKGSEVMVTRYEKGLAYVRLWSELSGDDEIPSAKSAAEKEQKL
jgi:hypothetical protein